MYKELCKIFATKTRDEWLKLFDEADVAGAPVYTIEETVSDPHVVHRGLIVEVDHPKLEKVKLIKSPFRLSATPVKPRSRPPLYGENTEEILKSVIGLKKKDITELRKEGVIE